MSTTMHDKEKHPIPLWVVAMAFLAMLLAFNIRTIESILNH